MAKVLRCPKCNGTDAIYNIPLKRTVCPNDNTPLNDFVSGN